MQYNKETFKQWWQFLQLSKDFRSLCELISRYIVRDSNIPIKIILDEFDNNENFRPIERYMKLLAVYEKFGDVHRNDFEEWWGNYNHLDLVKTIKELQEYKAEKYMRINEATDEQLKAYEKIRGDIIYFPDTYTFVQVYVNIKKPIKDIKSDFGKFIKKLKQTAETDGREAISPREEYLDILRYSQKGYTINQIIDYMATPREIATTRHIERAYRNKKRKALAILSHVENGRFP